MNAAKMTKRIIDAKIKYRAVAVDGFVAVESLPRCGFDTPVMFLNDGRYSGAVHNGKTMTLADGIAIARMTGKRLDEQ